MVAGLVADRLLGEPPDPLHPLRLFGIAMAAVENHMWRDRRSAGAVGAGAGLAMGAVGGAVLAWAVGPRVATAAATGGVVGGRALDRAATAVGAALEAGDLDSARALLPALVGRDCEDLDESGIARAVVESVAENTVDAVVAPALWALAGGAPAAFAYRAANTLDAMVGHRSDRYRRYGWASARLDDGANWVPARVTAALVCALRPRSAPDVWAAVRDGARAHPSPNSGVAEAAFAGALGLRLGGEVSYLGAREERPVLGHGHPPAAADIRRAVKLSGHVTLALAAAVLAAGRIAPGRMASGRARL